MVLMRSLDIIPFGIHLHVWLYCDAESDSAMPKVGPTHLLPHTIHLRYSTGVQLREMASSVGWWMFTLPQGVVGVGQATATCPCLTALLLAMPSTRTLCLACASLA